MLAALLLSLAQPLPEIIRRRPAPPAAEAPAEPAPAPAPETPPEPKLPPRASLIGDWSLGLARRGTRCNLTLSNHPWGQGLATASLGSNCPEGLFAVSRWRLTATELHLTNRTGVPLARLTPTEKGWTGTASNGDGVVMEKRR